MVEQTGAVRESELYEPIEDEHKDQTTFFSSYKQLLDFVDDCKDTIWFVHILPNEQFRESLVHLSFDKWRTIERRLAINNIQTGIVNCSNNEYSNLCRTLTNERFVLLLPSTNRWLPKIYSYEIYSIKHYDYQYILRWLSKTLDNHLKKDFDWYEVSREKRSSIELRMNSQFYSSTIPIYYFTLLYRYHSNMNFDLHFHEHQPLQIRFSLHNSSLHTYVYNDLTKIHNFHELYSYRSLNIFLSYLTINFQTLIYVYYLILNIYFLYDIYLVQSMSLMKKIFMINVISGFFWSLCLICLSTDRIDQYLQIVAFHFIKYSHQSTILMFIRNDLFIYSTMSKWILYPILISLHISIGLCFRWYLKEKFGRMTADLPNDVIMIDQTHALCSKVWQYLLCLLFSDHGPTDHGNTTFLRYFSQDSLWLDQHSLLTMNSNGTAAVRSGIDLTRLPIWRFTIRKRKTTHGASEYYSDMELEQANHNNEQTCPIKRSFGY
ncbi:unnamed protein product, partial [Adineta ricciae]